MSRPDLTPVQSSNLTAVGYDDGENKLYVAFKANTLYVYHDVPQEIYQELMKSDSKGKFLNQNVKNAHRSEKVA